jgi:hypothetical protein
LVFGNVRRVCYALDDDSVEIYLNKDMTQPFAFYMYTTSQAGTCTVRLTMRNKNVMTNGQQINLLGTVTSPSAINNEEIDAGLNDQTLISRGTPIRVHIPATGEFVFSLYDFSGGSVLRLENTTECPTNNLCCGVYGYLLTNKSGVYLKKGMILITP